MSTIGVTIKEIAKLAAATADAGKSGKKGGKGKEKETQSTVSVSSFTVSPDSFDTVTSLKLLSRNQKLKERPLSQVT